MSQPFKQCEFVGGPFDGHIVRFGVDDSPRPFIAIPVNRQTLRDPSRGASHTRWQRTVCYELDEAGDQWRYRFVGYLHAKEPRRELGPIAAAMAWLRSLPSWKYSKHNIERQHRGERAESREDLYGNDSKRN